jgi:hypothetical protein
MVLSPEMPGTTARFQVLLDGQPPGDDHGTDVDGQGRVLDRRAAISALDRPRPTRVRRAPADVTT